MKLSGQRQELYETVKKFGFYPVSVARSNYHPKTIAALQQKRLIKQVTKDGVVGFVIFILPIYIIVEIKDTKLLEKYQTVSPNVIANDFKHNHRIESSIFHVTAEVGDNSSTDSQE